MSSATDATPLTCSRCAGCGDVAHPPAPCELCGIETEPVEVARQGTLYSFTVIHRAAPGVEVPYALGYADLEPGLRLFARVTPIDRLAADAPVRLEPDSEFGYRFEVLPEGAA